MNSGICTVAQVYMNKMFRKPLAYEKYFTNYRKSARFGNEI